MRATINLGLSRSRKFGSRPAFSRTPGLNGSMRMSTCGISVLIRARPAGDFRFTDMELLRLVSWSGVEGGGSEVCAAGWARSMRRTVAPKSARRRPAKGPGNC